MRVRSGDERSQMGLYMTGTGDDSRDQWPAIYLCILWLTEENIPTLFEKGKTELFEKSCDIQQHSLMVEFVIRMDGWECRQSKCVEDGGGL